MKEGFLPIGTVVKLKSGDKEVMITSYCIFPTNTEIVNGKEIPAKKKIYEYGGCPYPEGIVDSNLACAFNHDQIEKIYHLGYETPVQQELSKILNNGYEIYKQQIKDNKQ